MLSPPGNHAPHPVHAEVPRASSSESECRRIHVPEEVTMNATRTATLAALLTLAALVSLAGCSQSMKQSSAQPTSDPPSPTASGTVAVPESLTSGPSLLNQLGGMTGVTQLTDAFGVNIAGDPVLSKSFDAASITPIKNGLVGAIANAGGEASTDGGAELKSALSGKVPDVATASALTSALSAAADQNHLGATQKAALLALFTPIVNRLIGT
jgi:hypothetical protein